MKSSGVENLRFVVIVTSDQLRAGVTCSNSPPLYPDTGPFLPVQNYPTLEP